MAAAQKLGYQPNVIARSLITRQSRLIGLVMGEWENPFYTTMLRDFTEKLGGRDYQLMLLASRTPADVEAAMRMLMRYRVDGIVFVSASPTPESAADYVRTGGRLVLLNREADGLPATSIVSDAARDGREIATRLLEAGYQRIALTRGDPRLPSGVLRTDALRRAIEASGRARILVDRSGVLGLRRRPRLRQRDAGARRPRRRGLLDRHHRDRRARRAASRPTARSARRGWRGRLRRHPGGQLGEPRPLDDPAAAGGDDRPRGVDPARGAGQAGGERDATTDRGGGRGRGPLHAAGRPPPSGLTTVDARRH